MAGVDAPSEPFLTISSILAPTSSQLKFLDARGDGYIESVPLDAVVSCISCQVASGERGTVNPEGTNRFPKIPRDTDLTNPDSATVLN